MKIESFEWKNSPAQLYNKPSRSYMNKLIIANWKEHKTIQESLEFLEVFQKNLGSISLTDKEVVICPSFTALSEVSKFVLTHHLPIHIGAQNVSAFEEGAYTGEVSASQIKEVAQYCIIGHSERRRFFHETPDDVQKKVDQALKVGLTPIVCVQDENEPVPDGVQYVAFEPVNAIGTGSPEDPKRIEQVFMSLSSKSAKSTYIYGGSIKPENVSEYASLPQMAGFLVGGASLDPVSFTNIITSC